MTTLFSVIIPVYNQERLIGRAIRSVLSQSHPVYELIVVDDGSTDGTQPAIAAASTDSRVRYVYQANGGVSAARNAGIRIAKGNWLVFLDADDFWKPRLLEHAAQKIAVGDDVEFVHVRRSNLFPDGSTNPGPNVTAEQMSDRFFLLHPVAVRTCGAMLKRELLDGMSEWFPESQRTGEDFHFFGRVVMTARAIGFVDSHDAVVCMTPGSLSRGTRESALLRDNLDTLRYLMRWADDNRIDPRCISALGKHDYWFTRELFAVWIRELRVLALLRELVRAVPRLGISPTSRALASALLGVFKGSVSSGR